MRQTKRQFIRFLVILACALPWAGAEAQQKFKQAGVIGSISYDSFTLHAKGTYRLAPGALIYIAGKAGARMSDLKAGDFVSVNGRTLGDVHYVDSITRLHLEAE